MRIGLVTGEFPPMQGGVGAFSERLAQALAASGHRLHVISRRQARPEAPPGRRTPRAQLRDPVAMDWGLLHPVARRWGWGDIGKVVQLALRYELDVINIQYQAAAYNMRSPAINLAPWRLRGLAPVVVTFHDLRIPYLFPKAGRLRRYVVRLAAQKAHGVIATNSEDYNTLQAWSLDNTQIRQFPIGSNIIPRDVDREEIAGVRHRLGLDDGVFLLGFFGFLNASKGAGLLVDALSRQDAAVHLLLIGGRTGSSDRANNERLVQEVDELVRRRGLVERVHWTGFLPDRDISTHLRAADLMVMPYRDGASLRRGTLMAALAHGRPVLTTRLDRPVAEFVHGENMWLIPAEDPQALAAAIKELRENEALRRRLSAGASRLADDFTWPEIAARTVAFFEELVADV